MNAKIKDVEIRKATHDDVKLFYPDGCPRTAYVWVALYKGIPACIAGLIMERTGCCAFSEVKAGHGASKMTIYRTAIRLMQHIKMLNLPMHAACDNTDKMAQKFVENLGFVWCRKYKNMELFVWQ